MPKLVSFDIDGTLENGGPPGVVTRAHVLYQREMGHIIGSASDRPIGGQRQIWRQLEIEPDFVVLKHRIADVREIFPAADEYWHIGDGQLDKQFSEAAGFIYFLPEDFSALWTPDL